MPPSSDRTLLEEVRDWVHTHTHQQLLVFEAGEADDGVLHGAGVGRPQVHRQRLTTQLTGVDTRMTQNSEQDNTGIVYIQCTRMRDEKEGRKKQARS